MASEPCTPRTRTSRSRRRAAPLRWLEAWWAGPPSSAMGAVYKRWMWLFCRRTRAMLGSFLQRSLGPRKPPAHRQPQKLRMLLVATLLKLRPTHLPPLQPPPLPLQLPGRVLMRLLQWLMTVRPRRRRRRHRHRPPPSSSSAAAPPLRPLGLADGTLSWATVCDLRDACARARQSIAF